MTGLVEHGIEGSNGKISRMFMLDRLERHARGATVFQTKAFDSMQVQTLPCTLVQNN